MREPTCFLGEGIWMSDVCRTMATRGNMGKTRGIIAKSRGNNFKISGINLRIS